MTTALETIKKINPAAYPKHVGIIMDGNGRWAKQQGKPRTFGHKAGVESVRAAVRFAQQHQLDVLTLFAFSSENWKRPEQEVSVLMELFMFVLTKEVKRLNRNNVRLKIIGDVSRFNDRLQKKIAESEALTKENDGLLLCVAANYGGRWDIANAVNRHIEKTGCTTLTEEDISANISLAEFTPLDLIIRTGGETRISNFLLWHAAYAEFYFTDELWPDFREESFAKAVQCFSLRQRRFGLTGDQVENA
ncbi:UDP diphosphate synthase [Catenovulum agarivorans DS-2]|uniref:Ditrans,polycis-undecaprenyl-diphosphate synthase ((2E,6E)-farnesyl-diphosphate specific) n=1 Tax=Catenovulum agarivorans DS-2 TaxID=1328313 RepID=W7R138_9ALTE|nr:polyprenyl diphosphate synthase [Catenovulum agarivorans]EWH11315.1 UDP diphosphate synthase [Catenovulum agarivorans DS-2]